MSDAAEELLLNHRAGSCRVQDLWSRLQNFLQYLFIRILVLSDASREERALSQSFGYDADGSWMKRSTAAAVLVGGDFSLEYPIPLPPKVHVRQAKLHLVKSGC